MFLKNLSIGMRLTLAFCVLVLLTIGAVSLGFLSSKHAATNIRRITEVRAPATLDSASAQANLLKMVADVRGYLALGESKYRNGYLKARDDFKAVLTRMQAGLLPEVRKIARSSDKGDDFAQLKKLRDLFEAWKDLPPQLFSLRDDQLKREPALRVLIKEATRPIALTVVSIKKMIETQRRQNATPNNMKLLFDMSQFQSSFFATVAGLRGYVSTGRENFKFEFESNLAINARALSKLVSNRIELTNSQSRNLLVIENARKAFTPLPQKMINWVEGDRARMDLFLFRTRAVPIAEKMMTQLETMTARQQALLQSDLSDSGKVLSDAQNRMLVIALLSALFGSVLAYFCRSIIVHPIQRLTTVASRFGRGELNVRAKVESGDEIGTLAQTFNRMSERLRETLDDLEAKQKAQEMTSAALDKQNNKLQSLSNQLSKYLSPQVYSSIFSGAQSVEISSKRRKLTIFFSDIVNFTETTDNLESEELTGLLNHYLTEMAQIALESGATIDKYVGDSIMAFFGDPESKGTKKDAAACVQMAIAMQHRMRELENEWRNLGLEQPFQLRIGINTGFCTVGNFGSEDRMDYTIIGGEVNLASRLETLCKSGEILLSHETYTLVNDIVSAEEQEPLKVKGLVKPVRTYQVLNKYVDVTHQNKVVRHANDSFNILVNFEKISDEDRAKAVKIMEQLLTKLKN